MRAWIVSLVGSRRNQRRRVLDDPKLHDDATYRQLTAVVRDATNRNESLGSRVRVVAPVGAIRVS